MTLKYMGFMKCLSGLSLAAFSAHWRSQHRDFALLLVGNGFMRGYVQNHRIPRRIEGIPSAADGVPEIWIDGGDALRKVALSREVREIIALDEPKFMDVQSHSAMVMTMEHSLGASPPRQNVVPLVKAMLFFRTFTDDILSKWDEFASPILMPVAHPVRLSRHRALLSDGLPLPPYAGVETSWWNDIKDFEDAWRERAPDAAGRTAVSGMLVAEEPVLWPSQCVDATLDILRWRRGYRPNDGDVC